MRTIIDLTDQQLEALKALCARERISRAEAIRRAVDRMVEDEVAKRDRTDATVKAAIGIWKHDRRDAREIVDELRSEWNDRP